MRKICLITQADWKNKANLVLKILVLLSSIIIHYHTKQLRYFNNLKLRFTFNNSFSYSKNGLIAEQEKNCITIQFF